MIKFIRFIIYAIKFFLVHICKLIIVVFSTMIK